MFCAAIYIYIYLFSVLGFPFFSHVCYLANQSLKISILLVSSYFCYQVFAVFLFVQVLLLLAAVISLFLFLALFNVFFESLYWCIYVIFNVGVSTSSDFIDIFCLCHLWRVKSMHSHYFPYLFVHLFVFLLCPFKKE